MPWKHGNTLLSEVSSFNLSDLFRKFRTPLDSEPATPLRSTVYFDELVFFLCTAVSENLRSLGNSAFFMFSLKILDKCRKVYLVQVYHLMGQLFFKSEF